MTSYGTSHQAVVFFKPESDNALAAERSLDARGIPIPLSSRVSYVRNLGTPNACLVAALDEHGGCLALLGFTAITTRAFPGHRVLRLEALGDAVASPAGIAVLREAA